MYDFAKEAPPDLAQLRARLQKMTDDQLLGFGKAARYMCSSKANMGKPPRQAFLQQLEEPRTEWRRGSSIRGARKILQAPGSGRADPGHCWAVETRA